MHRLIISINITYKKWQLLCQMKLLPLLSWSFLRIRYPLEFKFRKALTYLLQERRTLQQDLRVMDLDRMSRVLMLRPQVTKVKLIRSLKTEVIR